MRSYATTVRGWSASGRPGLRTRDGAVRRARGLRTPRPRHERRSDLPRRSYPRPPHGHLRRRLRCGGAPPRCSPCGVGISRSDLEQAGGARGSAPQLQLIGVTSELSHVQVLVPCGCVATMRNDAASPVQVEMTTPGDATNPGRPVHELAYVA